LKTQKKYAVEKEVTEKMKKEYQGMINRRTDLLDKIKYAEKVLTHSNSILAKENILLSYEKSDSELL
jgi:hypothetical protein